MGLTITSQPIDGIHAGFIPQPVVFKREDAVITSINASAFYPTKVEIIVPALFADLYEDDYIYVNSGPFDFTAKILYIYDGPYKSYALDYDYPGYGNLGGFCNYLKNYYVEVNTLVTGIPKLRANFSPAGYATIDLSIVNDLNSQDFDISANRVMTESRVQITNPTYQAFWEGGSGSATLIVLDCILVYATNEPDPDVVLNDCDSPKLYYTYPNLVILSSETGATLTYNELDEFEATITTGSLGTLAGIGFMQFLWAATKTANSLTKFIEFVTKKFELIRPASIDDENYEDHEFMLGWYGRDGAWYQMLFTDWEENIDTDSVTINETDVETIEALVTKEQRKIRLQAEELTYNDLQAVLSVLVAKKIIRIFKDGTIERVSIVSGSAKYRKFAGMYNFEFDVLLYQLPLPV